MSQTTGTLSGKVTAANGSSVPNAPVTVSNTATGFSQRALTAQDGAFQIANIPPGTYTIDVDVPGFKHLTQEKVALSDPNSNITLTLEAGSSSDTVRVVGMTGLIQSESGDISRSYDTRVITEVPLQDRNIQQVAGFETGVTPPVSTASPLTDPQRSRFWNTNGQPAEANRQNVGGIQNDEPVNGYQVHQTTLDGAAEFGISTSNYDVTQGRAAGSVSNVVVRSGTNSFHGSLFEFNDNSWASARNYFDPKGFPQAVDNDNRFGGSVGGPIVHDHTFFFGSWEDDLLRDRVPTISTVPTAAELGGDLSAFSSAGVALYDPLTGFSNGSSRTPFTNNIIPANRLNPLAVSLLGYLPSPNLGGNEFNYLSSPYYRTDDNRFEARIDHRFSDRAQAYLRYAYTNAYASEDSPYGNQAGFGGQGRLRSDAAMAGYTLASSPSFIWDARVGYNRYDNRLYSSGDGLSASALGFTSNAGGALMSDALPSINIFGLSQIGTPANFPQSSVDSTLNIVSDWSKRLTHHDLRFGLDFYGIRADGYQNSPFGANGGYTFGPGVTELNAYSAFGANAYPYSLAAFLLGAPSQTGIGVPGAAPSVYQYQYAGYVSDHLQPLHKLAVDIGVRYEYYDPLKTRHSAGTFLFDPSTGNLQPVGAAGFDSQANVAPNYLNFAPRLGFAYALSNRTVIRGGYGIEYFPGYLAVPASSFITTTSATELGFVGGYGFASTFGALPGLTVPNTTGAIVAPDVPLVAQAHRQRTPYVQSYNFGIQQDLGDGAILQVAYVGNTDRFLPYEQDLNLAAPGTGVAAQPFNNPAFGNRTAPTLLYGTGLTSNYNSLQAQISKRFAHGLAFTAAYTWSKSLDYGDSLAYSGINQFNPALLSGYGEVPAVYNYANPRYNYGPSDWDRTQEFTLTHVYQLPFGAGTNHLSGGVLGHILGPWQLDGVLHFATGLPYTPLSDAVTCNCPNNVVRADIVPSGTSSGVSFVPAAFGFLPYYFTQQNYAFAQAAPNTLGSAGRNILRGPDLWNYDLSVFRSFVFLESTKLEFRAEAYNLANSAHFANPITNVNSPYFGESIATLPGYGNRTLQFALRLVF